MASNTFPSYVKLQASGRLEARVEEANRTLEACNLCPRACGVDRTDGELGFCRGGRLPRISSFGPHFGEETPLVGHHGSGTIFFAGCNLGCCFCQNHDISHEGHGREVTVKDLALIMLKLQEGGCHNINLVTPTHFVPQLAEAVALAAREGLRLPIVYNCGGYEKTETLKLVENIVDIYMPDFKFWSDSASKRYCDAPDYPDVCKPAIKEMHRQVGDLLIKNGLAKRGLLVRHLVMPGGMEESRDILRFLAKEVSPDTFVNVMDQYRPCFRADRFPEIGRRLYPEEFRSALDMANEAGLKRIYY